MVNAGQVRRASEGVVAKGLVRVTNRAGTSPFVIICEHATNHLPPEYGTLGLDETDMLRHIAWDPGALPVSLKMAELLDAALIEAGVSRLAIDCNRPLDAPDLIPPVSETTPIPGNEALTAQQRAERIALSWEPFHETVEELVAERLTAGRETWLVTVHSFTPVYRGVARPWQIGILHDDDERLSGPLIAALKRAGNLTVGDNQPYSPADRVYFTLERHARAHGLPCAMIEIRNDEISGEMEQRRWAERLAALLETIATGREFRLENTA
jgi:predicted N-formylglutamate amidohydrolase